MDGRLEVCGGLVVAGRDPPPIFEATEDAVDDIAVAIGSWVEGMPALSGRVVGDDRNGPAACKILAQGIAVVSGVGCQEIGGRQRLQQRHGGAHVAHLAGRSAGRADGRAHLRRRGFSSAGRCGSDRSPASAPPFSPAAER